MSKTILITGAAGNLGQAVAHQLLREGYQVIGTLEPGQPNPELEIDWQPADLMDEQATQKLFENIDSTHSQLDGAVLLVGGFAMGSIKEASSADMMKMWNLNYLTAFHAAQNAYRLMAEYGGGKLVLVGAKPALEGGAEAVLPYAVSKAAVIKLAEILNESGKKDNIQASVIVPSIIDTPPNRKGMPDADFSKWVTPEQIAEVIGFILSDTSDPLRQTVLKIYGDS